MFKIHNKLFEHSLFIAQNLNFYLALIAHGLLSFSFLF